MTEQNGISFNPADAAVGGVLNDVDATIVKSEIVSYDFNGKTDDGEPRTCWAITYKQDESESDDDVSVDYITLGKLDQFTASPDGKRAVPVGSKTQLHKNSKAMMYARSLIENGFPANQLGMDVSVIAGLHVHLSAIVIPGFKGKDGVQTKDGKVTLVTKIHDKPAANAGKGKKAAPAAAKTNGTATAAASVPAAAATVDTTTIDPDGKAAEFVFNAIAESGGKIPKSSLPGRAFKAFQDAAERNLVVRAIQTKAWIESVERPWAIDDKGVLSVG